MKPINKPVELCIYCTAFLVVLSLGTIKLHNQKLAQHNLSTKNRVTVDNDGQRHHNISDINLVNRNSNSESGTKPLFDKVFHTSTIGFAPILVNTMSNLNYIFVDAGSIKNYANTMGFTVQQNQLTERVLLNVLQESDPSLVMGYTGSEFRNSRTQLFNLTNNGSDWSLAADLR